MGFSRVVPDHQVTYWVTLKQGSTTRGLRNSDSNWVPFPLVSCAFYLPGPKRANESRPDPFPAVRVTYWVT